MRIVLALGVGVIITALGVYFGEPEREALWYVRDGSWSTTGHAALTFGVVDRTDSEASSEEVSALLAEIRALEPDTPEEQARLRRFLDEERIRRIVAEELDHRTVKGAPALPTATVEAQRLVHDTATSTAQPPPRFDTPSPPIRWRTPEKLSRWDRLHARVSRFVHHLFRQPRAFVSSLFFGAIYYFVMLAGIFTGSIYEGLGGTDSKKVVRLKQVLRHARTAGTWQGILISPLIFALIKEALPEDGLSLSMAFLAFQNGFFWRATMKKLTEIREQQVARTS